MAVARCLLVVLVACTIFHTNAQNTATPPGGAKSPTGSSQATAATQYNGFNVGIASTRTTGLDSQAQSGLCGDILNAVKTQLPSSTRQCYVTGGSFGTDGKQLNVQVVLSDVTSSQATQAAQAIQANLNPTQAGLGKPVTAVSTGTVAQAPTSPTIGTIPIAGATPPAGARPTAAPPTTTIGRPAGAPPTGSTTASPPTGSRPAGAPPTGSTTASPPTGSRPAAQPPTTTTTTNRAPAAQPTTSTRAANSPQTTASNPPTGTAARGQAPGPSTTTNRAQTPSVTTARTPAPSTMTTTRAQGPTTPINTISPAAAPADSATIADYQLLTTATGSLSESLICQQVLSALSEYKVTNCQLISQTAPTSAGRRLHQQITINFVLRLSPVPFANRAAVRAALLRLNFTVITITPVTGNPPTQAPSRGIPGIAPGRSIARAPGPAAGNNGVVNAPNNANITMNTVPVSQVPTPTGNGIITVVTVRNTTVTTTITTFTNIDRITISITFVQFIITIPISGNGNAVVVKILFTLPGTLTVPPSTLGGGSLGQNVQVQTTGPTFFVVQTSAQQIIQSTTFSTSTTTTTTTTTNQPFQGQPLTTGNTRPGVTEQVCSTQNNPYGILPITVSEGSLQAGCNLVSSWNDVNTNTPGRGNIIWQCCPGNPNPFIWATVKVTGACAQDGGNVGLTMGISKVNDRIYQASLPQDANGNFRSGCIIGLDLSGNIIAEAKNTAVNGPWGMECNNLNGGGRHTCFVSNVGSMTPTTGRRHMLQTPGTGGNIARFDFTPPVTGTTWDLGTAVTLVSGIKSQPDAAGFKGGNVAPGQPHLSGAILIYPELLDNRISKIDNAFGGANQTPTVLSTDTALQGPNSVQADPRKLTSFVIANTGNGNLVFLTLDTQLKATVTPFNVDASNMAGNLFNAAFNAEILYFVADNTNTLNRVINLNAGPGGPASAPGATG